MKFVYLFAFLAVALRLSAQNVQFVKSVFSEQGPAGVMLTPNLKLENKGSTTEEINIKRVTVNLPANWYTCFCYLQCLPASVDTLHFFMTPGEIVDIGIGFGTDSVQGVGKVKIELLQVNSGKRDTLEFTGTTLSAGMKENSTGQFQLLLDPASELIHITSHRDLNSMLLTGTDGKIHLDEEVRGKSFSVSTGHLPTGLYILLITDKHNLTKKFSLIKL